MKENQAKLSFASDYMEGARPAILQRLMDFILLDETRVKALSAHVEMGFWENTPEGMFLRLKGMHGRSDGAVGPEHYVIPDVHQAYIQASKIEIG